jgi:catechol-2,3-dioxygenase
MNGHQPTIKSLGEVALRVENLERMQAFYTEVLGLTLMKRLPQAAFLSVAPDYGGHTQVLVLFDRSATSGYAGVSQEKTPLDHFAFTIDLADYAAWQKRLQDLGLNVLAKEQRGFNWRSLFFGDPEGNTVELVCYDDSVPDAE